MDILVQVLCVFIVVTILSLSDINECVEDIDDCEHYCINTEGGYNCTCDDGYLSVRSNCSGMYIVCILCGYDNIIF